MLKSLSFFRTTAPLDIAGAAAVAGARLGGGGDPFRLLHGLVPLHRAGPDEITAFFAGLDLDDLRDTRAGACLVALADAVCLPPTTTVLITETPRDALRRLAAAMHPRNATSDWAGGGATGAAARISATVRFEADVTVHPGAVVGDGVEVGSRTVLGPNCAIGAGVRIGRDCAVGSGAVLSHALVGDRVIIASGASLGEAGVDPRFEPRDPCLGRVIVQDDVAIGANAVVERGRWFDTVIGEGARVRALTLVREGALVERHALVGVDRERR